MADGTGCGAEGVAEGVAEGGGAQAEPAPQIATLSANWPRRPELQPILEIFGSSLAKQCRAEPTGGRLTGSWVPESGAHGCLLLAKVEDR